MEKNFVHLHLHTGYSLLDGEGKIKQVVARAKELGMSSIAITDHGVMYGCVDFYKAAKDAGIKPILGCEVYVVAKSMKTKSNEDGNGTHHLVLLVKNETGYNNLMKIVSTASIDGFYYKPRVDHEFLKQHSEGIIALSACLGGEVQSLILNEQIEKAKEAALFYKDTFKDGFYLELQYHGVDEERKVNGVLVQMSKELDIPLVATNDVHYIEKHNLENKKENSSEQVIIFNYKEDDETEDEKENLSCDLMGFLDAKTYTEKMNILKEMRVNGDLDEHILRNCALSIDCIVDENGIDEQYHSIMNCLNMLSKYECTRFR